MSDVSGTLPGDLTHEQNIQRMIRVNHAGEYGAKRIYQGQLAILGKSNLGPILNHMAEQEAVHLASFEDWLRKTRTRPSVFHPFWHITGFALGAGTALLGKKAAMACTVAVEEVIDQHYEEQLQFLSDEEPDEAKLKRDIKQFQAEELEHRDIGLAHEAELTPGYHILSRAIKFGAKIAIKIAQKY